MRRIRLYGVVGWEISAAALVYELEELDGEDVELHLASPGGYVDDALAIYTAIRAYTGNVSVVIDGLAASAASWIAMAGDEIWMGPSSLMMVHGPWTWASGDADTLRAEAEVLDRYAKVMRRAYARHGYDGDDLLVGGDHWFDCDEALEASLITGVLEDDVQDETEDEREARAMITTWLAERHPRVPEYEIPRDVAATLRSWLGANNEEDDVKIKRKRKSPLAVTTEEVDEIVEELETLTEDADDDEEIPAEDIEEVVEEVVGADDEDDEDEEEPATPAALVARERDRVRTITALQDRGYLSARQRDRLITRGVSANRARAVAIELGARNQTRVSAVRGGDAVEKRREGMVLALVDRGLGRRSDGTNEWRGRTLQSMAAACHPDLARRYDGAQLIDAVLANARGSRYQASADGGITHGASDFVHVLGDSAYRTLLIGYNEIEDTWSPWTNRAELKDFRPTPRVGLGAFAELAEVAELAEIPSTTLSDRGVTAQLKNYAGRFGIGRKALVNDDLSVFTEVPRRQGQAARRTVANHVYRQITSNALAPDGVELFHADHANNAAAVLDAGGISTLRALMRRQTQPTGGDADTDEVAQVTPRFLLVPPELYGYALELLAAALADGGGTNVWAGSLTIIEEPRLTNTAHWFLVASGTEHDTLEVAYLMGREEPMLDDMEGWTVLGVEFRVSLDFAVTLRDYRGFARGTGGAPA